MIYLSKSFVVAYHARLTDLFGGTRGLRDAGLLASTLAQAEATIEGEPLHRDVWETAAAYALHICRNHSFLDDNKRMAAVAMGTLLELNGAPLRVDEIALYQAMMALAEGSLTQADLAQQLRRCAPGS